MENRRFVVPYASYFLRKKFFSGSSTNDGGAMPTWWGPMHIGDDPSITPYLLKEGVYDIALSRAIVRAISPDMTIFNIGANIGYFCMLEAYFAKKGRIIGIEPDPTIFAILRKNASLHGDLIETFNVAIGNENRNIQFWIDEQEGGNNSLSIENTRGDTHPIEVSMSTIDEFVLKTSAVPDIVVMDIQGAEILAFKGMESLFKTHPPKILFLELWPFGLRKVGSDVSEFADILHDHGYRLRHIDPRSRLPNPEHEWESLIRHCDTTKNGKGFCNIVAEKIGKFKR